MQGKRKEERRKKLKGEMPRRLIQGFFFATLAKNIIVKHMFN